MLRLVIACVVCAVSIAHAGEMPRAPGMYTPQNTQLALVDSKIEVTVRGPIVEAIVTQKFVNRTDRPTEATYVFPLPYDAAVSAMTIDAGTKKIHAAIERRDQAQARYEAAVRAGVAGALLDQERPDIFTQTVAAVPAKGTVAITLRFDTVARYQDGTWELVLPLVVAPRYVPGAATNRPTTGTGRAPDTDRSPDASRITPGGSPGAGGATDILLKFIDKVTDVSSPTHDLKAGASAATLTDPKTDHDAIIRWKAPTSAAGWVEQDPDGGYAAIVVEGPAAPARRGAVRWTLMLDRSATSRGDAEAASRPLVRGLFAAMTPSDRVAVTGSDRIAWGTGTDVARAIEDRWTTNPGAFDLTRALQQARPEGSPILLVSGGLVADDRAALAAATKLGVPVHVIGVGPAPARGLLMQLATTTGGTVRFAIPGDDLGALAKAALADLAAPPAPLAVTWGTLQAKEVVPGTLPRLGAGQAIVVLARVAKAQQANGRARGELFAIETLPSSRVVDGATTRMGPLARRWARNRLDELIAARAKPDAIATHALRYGLVSPYTSMVAIGDEIVVQGGVKRSISVPVSVPAGMKWQQVKKETTVEGRAEAKKGVNQDQLKDADKGDRFAKKPEDKPTTNRPAKTSGAKPAVTKTEPPKKPAPDSNTQSGVTVDRDYTRNVPRPQPGSAPTQESADDAPAKTKRRPKSYDFDGDAAGADEEEDMEIHPSAPRTLALDSPAGEAIEIATADGRRKRYRIAASLGGGLVRSAGESASLLTAGARLELGLGRRTLAGVDASLWLVDGDAVRGQTLVSFAVVGIRRYLELGFGFGFQLGDGAGPAAGLSLRFHLPSAPRASLYLRYDGALIYNDDTRRGQSSGTAGVEWGF